MVETVARDVGDQFVAKGETENVSRKAGSSEMQCGKMSRPTVHSPPHQGSITINQQDMNDGHDSDHLHSISSHFSQDDQERDNPSSSSRDTRMFPLSNAITSVHLTTWGSKVRCHNQGGRSLGSTDIGLVVPTRGGVARASQVWQGGGYDRTFDVLAPGFSTTEGDESIWQVGKLLEMPAKTRDGEARLLEGGKNPARESSGEGGNGQKDGRAEEQGLSDRPKTASTTNPRLHTRTDERPVEKRSTEHARSRSWIHPRARGGSE